MSNWYNSHLSTSNTSADQYDWKKIQEENSSSPTKVSRNSEQTTHLIEI